MIAALIAAVLLAQPISDNSQQGQQPWCWAASSSDVQFCDYVSLGSCRAAHSHEEGACVRSR